MLWQRRSLLIRRSAYHAPDQVEPSGLRSSFKDNRCIIKACANLKLKALNGGLAYGLMSTAGWPPVPATPPPFSPPPPARQRSQPYQLGHGIAPVINSCQPTLPYRRGSISVWERAHLHIKLIISMQRLVGETAKGHWSHNVRDQSCMRLKVMLQR